MENVKIRIRIEVSAP